ncbi:MAG: phosphoglycerate kinase [Nanoarchaeota archaeon]|nr:phosphoglycerate kinase [Nanoarchaeota archaeon]MBU1027589.1 phosphoglycerate kinase [Nanoarchaeota archaeon]
MNLKGKTILLRADLDSNYVNKKIISGGRIKQAAETIKFLKKKGARVVVIAHQGRPNRGNCTSFKSHAKFLSKYTKVKFVNDLFGKKVEKAIKNLKNGKVILLENVRKYKEEYKLGKNKFVENLSNWCNIYVNDAFSNSHRKHTSMVSFAKVMPNYSGPLLEKEIASLKRIHLKKTLFILGGAKPKDNLKLLSKGKILACGLFGQMCLITKGKNLGAQDKYLKKLVKDFNHVVKKIKPRLKNVITPLDFGVKIHGKRKDLNLSEFPSKYEIFDIGPKTRKLFIKEIKKAKSIYMKGPVGDFSSKGFEKGTFEILKAIAKNKGFSLIGGGHLSDAIEKSGVNKKKFSHVSLSGGALLNYIAGEKLPGIEVLR